MQFKSPYQLKKVIQRHSGSYDVEADVTVSLDIREFNSLATFPYSDVGPLRLIRRLKKGD